jgi:hypothetical protein
MAIRVKERNLFSSLWRWIRRRRRLGDVKQVFSMDDVPDRFGGDVFVVGTPKPKWFVLECPCRCGDRIDVNLMTSRKPHWSLTTSDAGATLTPSLWMPPEKCGSHFFIRANKVVWVH